MKCPYCDNKTQVIDSRNNATDDVVRRRRECLKCKRRFTTHEVCEVIKKEKTKRSYYSDIDAAVDAIFA